MQGGGPLAPGPVFGQMGPPGPQQLNTTWVPYAEGSVPAVPHSTPPGGPVPVPGAPPPNHAPGFRLPFTNSTVLPSASGNIGQPTGGARGQMGQPPAQHQQVQQQQQQQQHDTQPLLNNRPVEDASKYAFYNPRRYRPLFDVDTNEVLWRVGNSLIGAFRANFMQTTQERPDLYGPFWVATTLIFVTAVSGNYAQYIEWRRGQAPLAQAAPPPGNNTSTALAAPATAAAPQAQWFTDYTKLGASAGIFYGYTFLLSFLLWLVMRYLRSDMRLVNMFCVYGYAMTIFIPVSLVCIIPVEYVRWPVVMGCAFTSGLFLLMNLKERIMPAGPGKAVPMLILVLALHMGLGLALKLAFFNY